MVPIPAGQLLTFRLAGDEYAVEILHIEEAVACGPLTRVPSAPAFIRGAMNLRGQPIPVIDLARKLGFPETSITRWTCLLLSRIDIHDEPTVLGVLVDEVLQLIECAAGDIKPPPPIGTRVHPEYLRGLLSMGDRFIPLLDLRRLLSIEELRVVTAMKAAPAASQAGDLSEIKSNP